MKKTIFLLLILLLFCFCAPNSEKVKKVIEDGVEVVLNHVEPYKIRGEPTTFALEEEFIIDTEKDEIAELGLTDIMVSFDVDTRGNIYLASHKNDESLIFQFDKDGNSIRSFASKGQGPGELRARTPGSLYLTVDHGGNIAASDFGNKLSIFGSRGDLIKETRIDSEMICAIPLENGNYLSYRRVLDPRSEFLNQNPLTLYNGDFEEIKELDKQMIPNPIIGKRLKGSFMSSPGVCQREESILDFRREVMKSTSMISTEISCVNKKLEHVDRGTTNLHASLLRRMVNKAKQRGYRVPETNPVIHSEHIKKVDARDRTLDFEEEDWLLTHLPEKLRPIVVTALHTGMRKKEILNLEWRDVNLDYRKTHIRAEKSKTHQDRHIPIDNELLSLLGELHRNNGYNEYVFTKDDSNPYADIQEGFAKARSEAGIEDLYFHDLRHTFATRAVKAGVDLFSLMKFLGHKDVTTTQRYVNLRDVDLLPAIEKLERFCEKSRKMSQKRIQPEKMTEVPSYAM